MLFRSTSDIRRAQINIEYGYQSFFSHQFSGMFKHSALNLDLAPYDLLFLDVSAEKFSNPLNCQIQVLCLTKNLKNVETLTRSIKIEGEQPQKSIRLRSLRNFNTFADDVLLSQVIGLQLCIMLEQFPSTVSLRGIYFK